MDEARVERREDVAAGRPSVRPSLMHAVTILERCKFERTEDTYTLRYTCIPFTHKHAHAHDAMNLNASNFDIGGTSALRRGL